MSSRVVKYNFTWAPRRWHALTISASCVRPIRKSKHELRELMGRSKIVVAWCMPGTERLPIEAITYGAVFLTNDCMVGSDNRDFPLPPQHRVKTAEALAMVIERILTTPGGYEAALEEQKAVQDLYLHLGYDSMAAEAAAWLKDARKPPLPQERVRTAPEECEKAPAYGVPA